VLARLHILARYTQPDIFIFHFLSLRYNCFVLEELLSNIESMKHIIPRDTKTRFKKRQLRSATAWKSLLALFREESIDQRNRAEIGGPALWLIGTGVAKW